MTFLLGLLVAATALAIGVLFGFAVGAFAGQFAFKEEMQTLKRHKLEDQKLYLGVLRRELANILVQRNPDRFLEFYSETFYQLDDLGKKTKDLIDAEEKRLLGKYPLIADWDQINTHDYVLYDNGHFHTEEDLYTAYRDIVIYQTILSYRPATKSDPAKWESVLTRKRLDHLHSYISEFKGTRLKHRLLEAMRQIDVHEGEMDRLCAASDALSDAYYSLDRERPGRSISTSQFTAQPVAVSAAESGYHFKFLDGDEGMVGVFHDDRTYVSVYGVDPTTLAPTRISSLNLDRISVPYEYRADVALGYSRNL